MSNIIAFAGSNSSTSINRQLVTWVVDQFDSGGTILDLNDFEMPIYSMDREKHDGIPSKAVAFKKSIHEADGLIISFAEHNGSYSTAFKNIFDWMSRLQKPIWSDTPMFLLATSPGKGGGKRVLQTAVNSFPHQGGKVVAHFSLPAFKENFDKVKGIVDEELHMSILEELQKFKKALKEIEEETGVSVK